MVTSCTERLTAVELKKYIEISVNRNLLNRLEIKLLEVKLFSCRIKPKKSNYLRFKNYVLIIEQFISYRLLLMGSMKITNSKQNSKG